MRRIVTEHHCIISDLKYTTSGGFVVIRTSPATMAQIVPKMKAAFKDVYTDCPFAYGFVDQDLSRLYVADEQMGKIFNVFSIVSILISCLGLFGLAAFTTQRRVKEIGVRRVLGASAAGIVTMFTGDFIKLVITALLFAFPLAWWAMNKWLDHYAYRIDIGWSVFALATLVTVMIALLTIGYQTIRAALTNPVHSLRSE